MSADLEVGFGEGTTKFRQELLRWFDRNHRVLPWRSEPTAYRVWISEIMLQQTQVVTVIDYFLRFIEQFPDIASLAEADEEQVLRTWEGLGYYRRARQLHLAAKQINNMFGSEFPEEFQHILALPGVGRYTAGAIASIAFGQRRPILEGNTIRLFARLLDERNDIKLKPTQDRLWRFAETLVAKSRRPGDVNQALMELGNRVCRVQSPECGACAVREYCRSYAAGTQLDLPRANNKITYQSLEEVAVVIERRRRFLLRRCEPGERWAGLWDFPRFAAPKNVTVEAIAELVEREFGVQALLIDTGWSIKHAVTRYRIQLRCFVGKSGAGTASLPSHSNSKVLRWVTAAELETLPLSATGRKIAARFGDLGPILKNK